MSIFSNLHKEKKSEGKKVSEEKKAASRKKEARVSKKISSSQNASSRKPVSEKKDSSAIIGKIKKTEQPAIIFKQPHISEKATWLEEKGKYVFRIDPRANKIEVKKAFEEMYRTKAISVKIINVPKKKRTWRGKVGYRPGYKKAIIQIAEDQKINIR